MKNNLKPRATFEEFWVLVNLNGPRYWKVTRDSISKCAEPPVPPLSGPVISFNEYDLRAVFDKVPSRTVLRRKFLTEYNDKCRVLVQKGFPVYAISITQLGQYEHPLYPGAFYLDQLLKKEGMAPETDQVVGFSFKGRGEYDDTFNILVLYAWYKNGEMSPPEISLNPPDESLVIREFAKSRNVESDESTLFPLEDVFGLEAGSPYPAEDDTLGIPNRLIQHAIFGALAITTAGIGAAGLYGAQVEKSIKADTVRLVLATKQKEQEVSKVITEQPLAFSRAVSVNTTKIFESVEALFNKYTRVSEIDASAAAGKITVRIKFQDIPGFGTGMFRNGYFMPVDEIMSEIKKSTPVGVALSELTIRGETHEIQVVYTITAVDTTLGSLIGG